MRKGKFLISKFIFLNFLTILILWLTSCSGTKRIPEGMFLYTGAEIKIENNGEIPNKKILEEELEEAVTPEPNSSFLGMRPKLWIYQVTYDSSNQKGVNGWLNRKLGEPPVYLNDAKPENTQVLLTNILYNRGYFQAQVEYGIERKKKTASIIYTSEIKPPYRVDSIFLPQGDGILETHIRNLQEGTLVKKGNPYDLDVLIEERNRLDQQLKNKGFYNFTEDYLIFEADTTMGNRKVNLYLKIKEDVPPEATRIYHMKNVFVYPNYSLGSDSLKNSVDTLSIRGYTYIRQDKMFRPRTILRSVFLQPDSIYSREAHQKTLRRLIGLNNFKFVNVLFRNADSLENGQLNSYVYLTPMPKKSLRLEAQLVSKSNNFAGPGLNISFRNRNFLRGAELLTVRLTSNYETQIAGGQKGLNSFAVGIESQLEIPRFITPIEIRGRSSFVPKTIIKLGYQVQSRVNYFRLNTFNASFGYSWKETPAKEHNFNPVSINYYQVGNISDEFQQQLDRSPYLKRSFQNQFILGNTYSFTYNDQLKDQNPLGPKRRKKNDFYFNGNVDLSGNLAYLLQSAINDEEPTEEKPYTFAGTPFAQYSRFDIDTRYYFNFDNENRLATRLIAGVGFPYGNSITLPYIKQFFAGGTNSIRAFRIRSVGPGSYLPADSSYRTSTFFDQTGDIKLEGNVEYRFPIISVLKGALFVDAGNIWTLDDNPPILGGQFRADRFLNQIAVGTGFGLRIDASFFVLRFDLAFPIRKAIDTSPDVDTEQGRIGQFNWVMDRIDFSSPGWRRENLVLNIAIGYPF